MDAYYFLILKAHPGLRLVNGPHWLLVTRGPKVSSNIGIVTCAVPSGKTPTTGWATRTDLPMKSEDRSNSAICYVTFCVIPKIQILSFICKILSSPSFILKIIAHSFVTRERNLYKTILQLPYLRALHLRNADADSPLVSLESLNSS